MILFARQTIPNFNFWRDNAGALQSPPCPLEYTIVKECTYRPSQNKKSKSNAHGPRKSPYEGIRGSRHHGQHHCFGEGFSTQPKTGCICFGKRSSDRHELENIVFQMPKKDEHAKILALVGIFPCKAFPERLFSSFFCRHSLFLRSNLFKSHALLERPHPRQLLKLSRPWMQYLWNLH